MQSYAADNCPVVTTGEHSIHSRNELGKAPGKGS
jgi:hypothetical protein